MSDRERWIVYPLLCFAVLLAWKNEMRTDGDVRFKKIECERIDVGQADRSPAVRIQGLSESGSITFFGQDGVPISMLNTIDGKYGSIELSSSQASSKILLSSPDHGGQIRISSGPTKPQIVFGFDSTTSNAGLFAVDAKNQLWTAKHLPEGVLFLPATKPGEGR